MSCPDKIQIRVRIQSGQNLLLFFKIVQIESRFFSGPDLNLDTIWTFFQNKNRICPDRIQIQIWILFGPDSFQKKSGHENQIIWTRKKSGRRLPTSGDKFRGENFSDFEPGMR